MRITGVLIITLGFFLSLSSSRCLAADSAPEIVPAQEESEWGKFREGMKQAGAAIAGGSKKAAKSVSSGAHKTGAAISHGSKKTGQLIATEYEEAKEYIEEKRRDPDESEDDESESNPAKTLHADPETLSQPIK